MQHIAEGHPPPARAQDKVIQRASNLPSVAQAKRIKIIPTLHKRLPGAAFSHPAIPQRLNVEILSDACYEYVLAGDWVVDRLVTS